MYIQIDTETGLCREFPGGPVVRTLCLFTVEGAGSIPGWGTKILQAARRGQNKTK